MRCPHTIDVERGLSDEQLEAFIEEKERREAEEARARPEYWKAIEKAVAAALEES